MPSRSKHSDDALLHEMRESAAHIHQYVSGLAVYDFIEKTQVRDAVCMRLLVMEAASKLSPAIPATMPGVNWKAIKGLPNLLAHDYGAAEPEILWRVAVNHVAELASVLPPPQPID